MSTEIRDNPAESRYELRVEGELAGFVLYRLRDNLITMYHTEIEPEYAGQGLGDKLAHAALEDARRRGLSLIPTCPFIAGYVRRHADDYLDLVVPSMRERMLEGAR